MHMIAERGSCSLKGSPLTTWSKGEGPSMGNPDIVLTIFFWFVGEDTLRFPSARAMG